MQSIICQMFLAMPLRLQNDLISLINHSSYDYRYCIIENHCKIAFLVPEKVWCLLSSIRKRASAVNDTNIIATCSEYLHEGREHDSFFSEPKWQNESEETAKKPLGKHCLPNTFSVNKNSVTSLIFVYTNLCERVVVVSKHMNRA